MDVTDIRYQAVLVPSSSYHYKFCENLTFEDNLNNTSISMCAQCSIAMEH